MQLHPIKPVLTAPGSKRLKLRSDEPLSGFAFKFNLRRYTKAGRAHNDAMVEALQEQGLQAGAYTRSHFNST